MESQQKVKTEPEYEFQFLGQLEGHNGWVTSLVSGFAQKENEDSDVLVSGSRDHTIITWKTYPSPEEHPVDKTLLYGQPQRQLTGHNHFVSDLSLSQENNFLISASWDRTLRLWDLRTGTTSRQFNGHTKEVFSVAFSSDNRQIISAGADKGIKLWNTLADNKYTSEQNNHTDWVSCIRYSPLLKTPSTKNTFQPYFTTVGWDGRFKVWDTNFQIRFTLKPHDGHINYVAISPNGKYIATGGRDKKLNIWEISDVKQPIRTIDAGSTINQISFNPKLQWVAASTEKGVKVWDLQEDVEKPLAELYQKQASGQGKQSKYLPAVSLCWNSTGKKVFAGFTDGKIRVWQSQAQAYKQ